MSENLETVFSWMGAATTATALFYLTWVVSKRAAIWLMGLDGEVEATEAPADITHPDTLEGWQQWAKANDWVPTYDGGGICVFGVVRNGLDRLAGYFAGFVLGRLGATRRRRLQTAKS